jgi:hypothetical protein
VISGKGERDVLFHIGVAVMAWAERNGVKEGFSRKDAKTQRGRGILKNGSLGFE